MRWLLTSLLLTGCMSGVVPVRFSVPASSATPTAIRAAPRDRVDERSGTFYTRWSSVGTLLSGNAGLSTRYRIELIGEGEERDIRISQESRICPPRDDFQPSPAEDCERHWGLLGYYNQLGIIHFGKALRDELADASLSR